MISQLLNILPLLIWSLVWAIGGWLIVVGFNIPRREQMITGVSLGMVLQLWLSNGFAHFAPILSAFWLGAFATLALGFIFAWPRLKMGGKGIFLISWGQLASLALIVYLFAIIGFGLNIFDDRQNLPAASLMALGDIPPHFPFDSNVAFGYHYLLILLGAQLMRLGDIFAWTAMDLARALVFGPTIMLTYLWTRRMTRSHMAGIFGGLFMAFSSGVRWILLIFPPAFVAWISDRITLIGSGKISGENLSEALTNFWKIEGAGPIEFPFAFVNGLNSSNTMAHNGVGVLGLLILILVLMLYRRTQDFKSGAIIAVLLAASALVSEFGFLTLLPNLFFVILVYLLVQHARQIPRSAIMWILIVSAASVISLIQGGVLTVIAQDLVAGLMGGTREGYHTFGVIFAWPPTVISAHLGTLSLFNPAQLLVALLEMGPVLLVLPLLFIWGLKMTRLQRWWEAILAAGAATGFVVLFVQYAGSAGISANSRLLSNIIFPASLYAVPFVWIWARKRTETIKAGAAVLGLISIFGGLFIFGIELIAAQKPTLPFFIQELDVRISKQYWNQLEPTSQVFDLLPHRAVTVFGRFSDSYETLYIPYPEWVELGIEPDPYELQAAGYDYVYFGAEEWDLWSEQNRTLFQDACVQIVDEVKGIRAPDDYRKDFRRLINISACK